jgi:hypothetical protein
MLARELLWGWADLLRLRTKLDVSGACLQLVGGAREVWGVSSDSRILSKIALFWPSFE